MERNRNKEITALYERENHNLIAAVSYRVGAAADLIEDACMFAWASLSRREDVDPNGAKTYGWLLIVATHEGWRLAREETSTLEDATEVDVAAIGATPEDTIAAREALDLIEQLPARERRVMRLFAAGFSYKEIADALGLTYTNVNKHITRARKRMRQMRGEE